MWHGLPPWGCEAGRAASRGGGGLLLIGVVPRGQAHNDSAFTMTFGLKNKLRTIFKGNTNDRFTPYHRPSNVLIPDAASMVVLPPTHPWHPFEFQEASHPLCARSRPRGVCSPRPHCKPRHGRKKWARLLSFFDVYLTECGDVGVRARVSDGMWVWWMDI
ncbi:hypothetical protein T484DRAFT_1943353 [Baffinella frigidus]|nr:hypothetical protein T484DRAFT_1943353 [Cryptophyta sp. CCMP2293]